MPARLNGRSNPQQTDITARKMESLKTKWRAAAEKSKRNDLGCATEDKAARIAALFDPDASLAFTMPLGSGII
jgi:hypothetical protein